jgi:hypothetical protein
MEKIPTAKEYFLKTVFPVSFVNRRDEIELCFETTPDYQESVEIMIEFAKLHVEAALKAASEGQINRDIYMMLEYGEDMNFKKSILNSYPLENIK